MKSPVRFTEGAVYRWIERTWTLALADGRASEFYYFHLVTIGLNCLLGKPDYWR